MTHEGEAGAQRWRGFACADTYAKPAEVSGSRRRALLVSPSFFGYEQEILDELAHQGLDAEFVDERPSNSSLLKAIYRVNVRAAANQVDRYYRRVARNISWQDLALVLVIRGEIVPPWFLTLVRSNAPDATIVFYTWDSVKNNSNFEKLLPYFDYLFSFEDDAQVLDDRFRIKHLFYSPSFYALGSDSPRRFEGSFVGTLHSGRYAFTQRILNSFESSYTYFFVQARWYFALRRIFDRRYRAVPRHDVSFSKLRRSQVAEVFRNSLAVLDMQHEDQAGLTMRTFEVLASGAYLITTNASIRNTPLMSTDRVIVVDEHVNPEQLVALLRGRPVPRDAPDGFEVYSLSSWVRGFVELLGPKANSS